MLLGHDPYTGITEHFSTDEAGNWVIKSVQDAEPWIKRSAELSKNLNKSEEWWYIGSTPPVVDLQWANESNTKVYSKEWVKYAHKKLNSAEFRKFNPNKIKL